MTPDINQISNGIAKGVNNKLNKSEVIGLSLGTIVFAISIYSFYLSIKVNKLSLKKLKDEGYE
jgi:hypothetical protein